MGGSDKVVWRCDTQRENKAMLHTYRMFLYDLFILKTQQLDKSKGNIFGKTNSLSIIHLILCISDIMDNLMLRYGRKY